MTQQAGSFEYAMGVFSVLIGLAVADIATSFHRLVRSKSTVTWDPLALLAAFYALCLAVAMWFDIWGVRNFASTRHFFFYLALVADLFLLFLIAAASLPDEPGADSHLGNYYAGTRRYFWSLVTLFQILYFLFGLYFVGADLQRLPQDQAARLLLQMCAPALIALALAAVQSRAVHYTGLVLLFLVMAAHYASLQIN
jgi:hypothetical protein